MRYMSDKKTMEREEHAAMRRFMDHLIWIVSIFTMIAVLMGCGSREAAQEAAVEKAVEQSAKADGQDVDVDIDGDSMTIKSDGGKSTVSVGEGTTIPSDFPSDVPTYPDAKVLGSFGNTEQKAHSLQLSTTDPLDKVQKYLQEQAVAKGWSEDSVMNTQGGTPMAMLMYKKENRILSYTVSAEGTGANIALTVAQE
jgi:hypothetical protein